MVLDISDIATILVISGIIFIFIAIVREISGYLKTTITTKQAIILGITGVILLGLGLFASGEILPPDSKPTPTPPVTPSPSPTITPAPEVTIEITDPKEGAEVSSPLTVEGTFDGELPEDWYLWMFVDDYEEWWPVNRIEPFEGKWKSKVWLGVGTRDIVVVLGDKDADSEFQQIKSEGRSLGILPQGVQVCDRVTVKV